MTISVVDFFCGCGGTSAGLENAGMQVLAGIDNDDIALKTFSKNFPNAKAIESDISELEPKELSDKLCHNDGMLLFAACAPCQPFSAQNRHKSSKDERKSLLSEFHRFVKFFEPDFIILENVPGLQRVKKGPFTKFVGFLTTLGYHFDYNIKNAVDYGVPQSRRRLVLVASKHGPIELPTESHGSGDDKLPYETVWTTIGGYPELFAGQSHNSTPNHVTAKVSELNLKRLKATPEGGDRRDWPKNLLLECHKKAKGYTDTYGRLWKDQPARTLTTKCVSVSNGRFGHPIQHRALSVREAAALQSFDDNFVFEGTLMQTAKQVGNAVPVRFAEALGEAVNDHITSFVNGTI